MLQLTPLESLVEAAIEKVFAVAIVARAIGRLTVTFPVPDEEDELVEEVEDVELDVEETEDERDVAPSDPPPPHAGRIAAQASMPPSNSGAMSRSSVRRVERSGGLERSVAAAFVVELRLLLREFSRIHSLRQGAAF